MSDDSTLRTLADAAKASMAEDGIDWPNAVMIWSPAEKALVEAMSPDVVTSLLDRVQVAEAALENLTSTLESIEFRAGVLGLTCSQDDSRRIAVAHQQARAALAGGRP